MMKHNFLNIALSLAIFFPAAAISSAAMAQDNAAAPAAAAAVLDFTKLPEPMKFAKAQHAKALELNAMEVSEKRDNDIRTFVAALVDYDDFAKRSLGKRWDSLSADKRSEFCALFRELLELSYIKKLSDKSFKDNYPLDWDRVVKTKDSAIVSCFTKQKDVETELEIVLHAYGDSWKVYDTLVDGASLANTYQKKYNKKIDEKGIDAIMADMKSEIEKLKAK